MKLLVTGDLHMDTVTAGVRRLPEVEGFVEGVIEGIKRENVDLALFLGDYFNPGTMRSHELTTTLTKWAARIDELVTSVWIAGNHDVVETSEGWTTISPLTLGSGKRARVVAEKPISVGILGSDGLKWVTVLCLPYVARSAQTPNLHADAIEKTEAVGPIVVVSHLTVPGAVMSSESTEMSRGRDTDFPVERVAKLKPALVFNGHYHRAQTVDVGPFKIHCPGSPLRNNFGERNDRQKGYLIAEVE